MGRTSSSLYAARPLRPSSLASREDLSRACRARHLVDEEDVVLIQVLVVPPPPIRLSKVMGNGSSSGRPCLSSCINTLWYYILNQLDVSRLTGVCSTPLRFILIARVLLQCR